MGLRSRDFIRGLTLGLLIVAGCGTIPFTYRYYGLNAKSYEGMLLGPMQPDDLPFSICTPSAESRSPCVVLKAEEFYALKLDYLQTKQDLITCQSPK